MLFLAPVALLLSRPQTGTPSPTLVNSWSSFKTQLRSRLWQEALPEPLAGMMPLLCPRELRPLLYSRLLDACPLPDLRTDEVTCSSLCPRAWQALGPQCLCVGLKCWCVVSCELLLTHSRGSSLGKSCDCYAEGVRMPEICSKPVRNQGLGTAGDADA